MQNKKFNSENTTTEMNCETLFHVLNLFLTFWTPSRYMWATAVYYWKYNFTQLQNFEVYMADCGIGVGSHVGKKKINFALN